MVNDEKSLELFKGKTIISVDEINGCLDISFSDGTSAVIVASTEDDVHVDWVETGEDNKPFHPYDLVDLDGSLR